MRPGVLITSALTALATAQVFAGGQSAAGFNVEKLQTIPSMRRNAIDAGELPGVVTVVWRNGRVVQLNAVGRRDIERGLPMTPDTIFRIASMSKPVTSAAATDAGRRGATQPGRSNHEMDARIRTDARLAASRRTAR
jgi:CubicO group peptidase (beta-lactamase class C family)